MKILMVCLGNICRSPMAEGILQHLADERGLGWKVDSAGTGGWHAGQAPDRRAVRTAHRHGIDISKQVCRQFRSSDFDDFDLVFVMDNYILAEVLEMAPDEASAGKVSLLPGNKEVPDPYYDETMFEPVFELIETGCEQIIREMINKDAG